MPNGRPEGTEPSATSITLPLVLALNHLGSGKVREIYEVDDDRLLIVASDRISAYDVVMTEEIPDKGRVLTGVSNNWFDLLDTPHHLLSNDPADVSGITAEQAEYLRGRMMLVRRCEVIPMECVIRGYLYGSSWREYRDGGGPTTEHLPDGSIAGVYLLYPDPWPKKRHNKRRFVNRENLRELHRIMKPEARHDIGPSPSGPRAGPGCVRGGPASSCEGPRRPSSP